MNVFQLARFRGAARRISHVWPAMLLAAGALLSAGKASAVGAMVDVEVVERDTGAVLHTYHHRGSHYVAGRPGARYAIRISNRSGGRVLAVMSVDGVNIVSGQTASWNQSGYVLGPWQTHEVAGWRKSQHEVAAFEFTALPDSYAARTGRPHDVGVIGVAVFTERIVYAPAAPPVSRDERRGRLEGSAGASAEKAEPSATPAPSQDSAASARRAPQFEAEQKLGTGHGAREDSYASTTTFTRSSNSPVELVSIRYDRYENLARMGVFGGGRAETPRPFPRSGALGFVPDPPNW